MARFTTSSAMVVGLACCALFASLAVAGPKEVDPAATEMLNLGLRGVYFVPNHGQWSDSDVHYGLRSRGLDVAFRESALTMHMTREVDSTSRVDALTSRAREEAVLDVGRDAPLADSRGSSGESADIDRLTLTITFPGSNAVWPVGGNPQAAKFNYFVGGEGRTAASDVPSFGEIVYPNLYDGVDLIVCGNDDGILKYEFHVAPGADYTQIRIAYDGIDSLCIDDGGNLQINTAFGTLADGAPVVWQVASTSRAREEAGSSGPSHDNQNPLPYGRGSSGNDTIAARFELCDARTYRIVIDGHVDPTRALILDPDLEWMYYLGGSDYDYGYGIAVDSAGNSLVTGHTRSTDFEGRNNSYHNATDAFVVKVNASGTLQWMTCLGGSEFDRGYGIAVDSAGDALVTGETYSTDFAGRNNAHHGSYHGGDAFVVKVSASGALQWMTYLGGVGGENGTGIAADSAGNALVTGHTRSTDFEGRNNAHHGGMYDAYAVKVSASGALQWMTYLGGTGQYDHGHSIAVDGTGNLLVTGGTNSTDFEGRNNANHGRNDAFVVKVSALGILQWMTYLGGSNYDYGYGIAVDSAGNSLVTGTTESPDFEGRNNSYHNATDAFVVKVNASGTFGWMTYLGGSSNFDRGRGIAVDSAGNALVAGDTDSIDFEGRNNANHGGPDYDDAFVVKVSASGALQWMTYLGGSGNEEGWGIAVDSAGNALVTGYTVSTDFEGRNNAYHGGYYDAFIVKLRIANGLQLSATATCPSGGPIQVAWSGATPNGQAALLFALSQGAYVIPNNRPCAGTQLGLGPNQIELIVIIASDSNGSRTVNSNTGPGACGGYLQLLDLTTCGTSNVARVE